MPKGTTKKTVFFIVEGKTDKTALEKIFQAIYNRVKCYKDYYKLKKTDIWQIVQIFDTDGTFIPETAIAEGETSNFIYSTTNIGD